LSAEQKENRVDACQDLIEMADGDSDLVKESRNGDGSWCFADDQRRYDNHSTGERKFVAAKQTSIPEVSNEDHVDLFLPLVVSHAPRMCTGRTGLTLNSREK
jgi:hypothetical protein